MFIKHRPYGAFYYYSESIVTFSMTLFLKTFILKGLERKKEKGKENSRAPCSSLFADLSVFNVSFTEPPSKKKKRKTFTTPFTARKSQADRRMTFLTAERQEVRKKGRERERRGTRKWNVTGSHTRSNLATCQSTSCLIRRRSEAPGRRAVSQYDTLRFMNEASGGPAACYTCPFNHGSKRIYFDGTLLVANEAWKIEDRKRRPGECWGCWIRQGRTQTIHRVPLWFHYSK